MICVGWSGFPQYAARCVGAFVRTVNERVCVVATRPTVPVEGMERLCGCPVVWADAQDGSNIMTMLEESPRVMLVSGWSVPMFNRLAEQVRANGGRVIAMVDNNFVFGVKECVKALRFRLFLRRRFDAFFVPGKSATELLRFYGVPPERIATGLYAADDAIFGGGEPLDTREKRIVYMGQFCERKNVLMLVAAFRASGIAAQGWRLDLYGCGPQKDDLPQDDPSIGVHDFVQPEALADIYRGARAFALSSREEHWGLVVHEAALCGCALLLSNRVGAASDLLTDANGVSISPFKRSEWMLAFRRLATWSSTDWRRKEAASRQAAKRVSVARFVQGVKTLTMI